jgi:hypothetical protein
MRYLSVARRPEEPGCWSPLTNRSPVAFSAGLSRRPVWGNDRIFRCPGTGGSFLPGSGYLHSTQPKCLLSNTSWVFVGRRAKRYVRWIFFNFMRVKSLQRSIVKQKIVKPKKSQYDESGWRGKRLLSKVACIRPIAYAWLYFIQARCPVGAWLSGVLLPQILTADAGIL